MAKSSRPAKRTFCWKPTSATTSPPVIAAAEKITLTDEHWTVINFMREKYKEDGSTPNFRNMLAEMDELHPGTDWKKKLYELFPNQPARQSARVAGLTKPYGKGGY
jgi:TusE/DsrC/DsvC family sulfur relay protein